MISITAMASLSALGNNQDTIWKNYQSNQHCFVETAFGNQNVLVAPLDVDSKKEIEAVRNSDQKYKSLDNSVLFAIAASRKAIIDAGWKTGDSFGINIGSSRGATELFEKHHLDFIKSGQVSTLASPTSTLGNISS
jgi:3-oxoacyl-(acyl-carrier-protein) synthase